VVYLGLGMCLLLTAGAAKGRAAGHGMVSPPGDDPIGYACPDFSQNAAVYRPRTPTGTPALIGLPNGNTWVTAQPNFVPDRRPLVIINFTSGAWSSQDLTAISGEPEIAVNYVPLIENPASKFGNQFGLTWWWFGKHSGYPGNLADTPSDSKESNFSVAGHILRKWTGDAPEQPPVLRNANGGANGIPDQVDRVLFDLERYFADGFRRFLIYLPGGVPFGVQGGGYFTGPNSEAQFRQAWGGHSQPMNQWQLMPEWKKQQFLTTIKMWAATHSPIDPPPGEPYPYDQAVSLELYTGSPVGSDVNDPCVQPNLWSPNVTLANQGAPPSQVNAPRWVGLTLSWGYDNVLQQWFRENKIVPITPCAGTATFDLDPREVSHLRYVWDALNPWRAAGFNRFWLDAGADNANVGSRRRLYGFIELAHNPVFHQAGYRFGAEAFPVVNNGADIDECNAKRAPWLGLMTFASYSTDGWQTFHLKNWQWQRGTTEAVLWVDRNTTFKQMLEARWRGYVLAASTNQDYEGRKIFEQIKRVYGMGWIYQSDFNGDGKVNAQDYDDWLYAKNMFPVEFPGGGFKSFGFGNVNNDDRIDELDGIILQQAIAAEDGSFNMPERWFDLGIGQFPNDR
jgi:hypothetical protein